MQSAAAEWRRSSSSPGDSSGITEEVWDWTSVLPTLCGGDGVWSSFVWVCGSTVLWGGFRGHLWGY